MDAFPALINVEEFISDYFFTTDESKGASFKKAVTARIKEWKQEDFASPLDRLNTNAQHLLTAQALAAEELAADYSAHAERPNTTRALKLMCAILGIPTATETLEATSVRGTLEVEAHRDGSTLFLQALHADSDAPISDVQAWVPLHEPTLDGKPAGLTVPKLVGELFVAQPQSSTPQPQFIVILTPRAVLIAHRDSWHLGRHLIVDVVTAIERGDKKQAGELQRVACAIAAENLTTRADGTIWWEEVLAQSLQHSVSVSASLRGALRESIEIIANDVLDRRRAHDLPVDASMGEALTHESLRYLYRILFLLFAEASPELEILPVGEDDYELGYGLARLREQLWRRPQTKQEEDGTYLYESLQLLFDLVNRGHYPANPDQGLSFEAVEADLFKPEKTELIDATHLSNKALLQVLEHLLLSKETRGRDRGFISYATLGVTELGQVYEGLMSFRGFIAEETLYEVAKNGDASKGSWVVPATVADADPATYSEQHFVTTVDPDSGEHVKRAYRPGSFVYRQSARDRERSASFYTPQVISQFTVSQAIEQLQESGRIQKAEEILHLRLLEPALGSGAFGVETVRQLAELYLQMRQHELDTQIPAEDYTKELQRVKSYLALHCMYGVDLNATAVELGEISLWLDSMSAGLKAPWFGLHLRRGNSLIGATRAAYGWQRSQENKVYLTEPPARTDRSRTRIYQFLLPSPVWGASASAKELKAMLPDETKALLNWTKTLHQKLTPEQITELKSLSARVDTLWNIATLRLQLAESQVRRDVEVFGFTPDLPSNAVSRTEIEQSLSDPESAFQRLRLVMDAWCALKFWPVGIQPPSFEEWLKMCRDLLGEDHHDGKQHALGQVTNWEELNTSEAFALKTSKTLDIAHVLEKYPWLEVVRRIAESQAFFHWELDFAPVFAGGGGFDLIVGNPPWVRPDIKESAILADIDPWWALAHKPTQHQISLHRDTALGIEENRNHLVQAITESVAVAAELSAPTEYPWLLASRPDLYRGFMCRAWTLLAPTGIAALVHPESHFTDAKAVTLRRATYPRLRRHFHLRNALMLFDIDDHVDYGVHIYGAEQEQVHFINLQYLFHPKTAAESLRHDGTGPLPGIKDSHGNWSQVPHAGRVQTVTNDTLRLWNELTGDTSLPTPEAKLGKTITSQDLDVLQKLAAQPRIAELGLQFSGGWNETTDRKKGYFDHQWAVPDRWADVIIQGPHLGLSTPMIKQPNPTLKHNQDWSGVDLEAMPADFIPATAYQRTPEKHTYELDYTQWDTPQDPRPATDFFRVAWRSMAATTGFRTLYPAVIPPAAAHVHGVLSAGNVEPQELMVLAASTSSIPADFLIRSVTNTQISGAIIDLVPLARGRGVEKLAAKLHCVTEAYAPLWEAVMGEPWTPASPARTALERYLLQVEIDAAVAREFGISADELCTIYRTQFPVMHKYDRTEPYDANGRKVPKAVLDAIGDAETMAWTHPQSGVEYVFAKPFECRDREADMREAYERLG